MVWSTILSKEGVKRPLFRIGLNTLSGKISPDKIFAGQNISSDKIFDTKPKFRQFCPIFAWLLYWNIGQNFRRTKCFVGQNFRHQAEISTLLSDEFLSDKVSRLVYCCKEIRYKLYLLYQIASWLYLMVISHGYSFMVISVLVVVI